MLPAKVYAGREPTAIVGGVTSAGVTPFEGALAVLGPTPFVATTVNVYVVPFVRPVTMHWVTLAVHVLPPGLEVAV
jgi:hypothetical protein